MESSSDAVCELVAGLREVFERGEGHEAGETGRIIERKVDAICDRAVGGRDQLDAVDSLGFHVRLILDNEEGTYNHVRHLAREHLRAADPCPMCQGSSTTGGDLAGQSTECPHCGPAGTVRRHPHQLGEALREYVEDLAGLEGATLGCLAREVLSTALDWVNWDEMAAIVLSEFDPLSEPFELITEEAA